MTLDHVGNGVLTSLPFIQRKDALEYKIFSAHKNNKWKSSFKVLYNCNWESTQLSPCHYLGCKGAGVERIEEDSVVVIGVGGIPIGLSIE